jgi:uncharacterized membrane protein YedE/YeeE
MSRTLGAALVAGLLFGIGLALSGMTDPERVLGFLDLFGAFDPTLLFVLGGAVMVTVIAFRFVLRLDKPVLAERFDLPTSTRLDARVLIGAAVFGVGWGIAGYCPGPALAGLGVGSLEAFYFVPAMLLGALLYAGLERLR